jgi:hypothetical protein
MVGLGAAALAAASALWLYWPGSTLTRQEAIDTAELEPGGFRLAADRVIGSKLIHRFDLPKIIEQDGATDARPFDRVWVVVVKGELIPSTMGGTPPATYTVEVIRDMKPPRVEVYYGGGPGNKPPAWDGLVDLARH